MQTKLKIDEFNKIKIIYINLYSWSNTFATKNDLHDLPLKFSRSAGTPLSLVSAISAAKFIILLSLTGLLNLADIVKKNQSYVHKNTLFTKFRCQTDALSESHECFTRRQVETYMVQIDPGILFHINKIFFFKEIVWYYFSLIFQSNCTTAYNPNHFRDDFNFFAGFTNLYSVLKWK